MPRLTWRRLQLLRRLPAASAARAVRREGAVPVLQALGQPQVRYLGHQLAGGCPHPGQQHIAGLQVSMHHAEAVQLRDALRHPARHLHLHRRGRAARPHHPRLPALHRLLEVAVAALQHQVHPRGVRGGGEEAQHIAVRHGAQHALLPHRVVRQLAQNALHRDVHTLPGARHAIRAAAAVAENLVRKDLEIAVQQHERLAV